MSISNMYAEFKAADKETFRRVEGPAGRYFIYFTDHRGREFVSLFNRHNSFEGTHPLNGPAPN